MSFKNIRLLGDFFYDSPHLTQQFKESIKNIDLEALITVQKARKLKNNFQKAQKLFEHALLLSPNHCDVLLHYGEFLESNGYFVNADHFYLKAFMLGDSRALENRKRTLPVVNQLDLEDLERIDIKKNALRRTGPIFHKETFLQHIYHTVAIEGNTLNLEEIQKVIETHSAIPGKSTIESEEVLGLEDALHYVNQTFVSQQSRISVKYILDIHKKVMGRVNPEIAGNFRKSPVFVGKHTPPESGIETLMDEFVELMNSSDVRSMHPIRIAALMHYKFVFIHPFLDGNGRTARILMNLILGWYNFPSVCIKIEEKDKYFEVLEIAQYDIRPFYRFITQATENAIDTKKIFST